MTGPDAMREVLRSPLDDLPVPGRGGLRAILAFVLAAAAGIGAVAATRALTSAGGAAATTTTTIAPATTLPGPVAMGELGVEVAAAWEQDGRLYATVTTTVTPGASPEGVHGLPSAHWVLRLPGGDLLTATAEYTSPAAPGMFTVEFPIAGLIGPAEILVYPADNVIEAEFPSASDAAQLPWAGPLEGAPFPIGEERLAVDSLRIDDAGGQLTWHLAGSSAARAVVSARASYTEVGGEPQLIVPEEEVPVSWLIAIGAAPPSTRSGLVHLFRLDDPVSPTFRSRFLGDPDKVVPIRGLTVLVNVRLFRYAGDPVVVPFEIPSAAGG